MVLEDFGLIAIKINKIKDFMSKLLLSDTFDNFYITEGEITTFNTFKIDGFIKKDFYEEGTVLNEYSKWGSLRELCYSIIKGKRTPLDFKFIFGLSEQNIENLIIKNELNIDADTVQGLYMNIRYDGSELYCITGTSFKSFTMDKSLENVFDKMVLKFFSMKDIEFEQK